MARAVRPRPPLSALRLAVVGAGAVGGRAARHLLAMPDLAQLHILDRKTDRARAVAASLGAPATGLADPAEPRSLPSVDLVLVATAGPHRPWAEAALEQGAHVVSTSDDPDDVRDLLALDPEASGGGRTIVVGAAFSPGLSCLLARHAATGFDAVTEIHVASTGTGGPACAQRHHQALGQRATDWRDGDWERRPRGWGREVVWFPDPVGGAECVRAGLAEPRLLVPAFPGVTRVSARLAASRRDRMTASLPMLRRPHPEGLLGALRVEVRGQTAGRTGLAVLGAIDRPAVAAGAVAATAARWTVAGRLRGAGAAGLATLVPQPGPFLHELAAMGVRAAIFEGG